MNRTFFHITYSILIIILFLPHYHNQIVTPASRLPCLRFFFQSFVFLLGTLAIRQGSTAENRTKRRFVRAMQPAVVSNARNRKIFGTYAAKKLGKVRKKIFDQCANRHTVLSLSLFHNGSRKERLTRD